MTDARTIRDELTRRFTEVDQTLDRTCSTLEADPLLAGTAAWLGVQEENAVRTAVLEILAAQGCSPPIEAVEYLAHRFRWPWLRAEFERRFHQHTRTPDHRRSRPAERVLEAFAEDWEDRDLFPSLDEAARGHH